MSATLFMPIILDLSNSTIARLFGESFTEDPSSGEPFQYHLKWDISSSGVCSINDMSGVLFGDQDSGNALFYQTTGGIDKFTTAIQLALQGDNLYQSVACSTSKGNCIPTVFNESTSKDDSPSTSSAGKTAAYSGFLAKETGKISVGEALLRVMSTHLLGHPLAQTIIKNDSDFLAGANTAAANLAAEFKSSLGGTTVTPVDLSASDSSNITSFTNDGVSGEIPTSLSDVTKASGTANQIFKSILEQLMANPNTKDRFTETARPTEMSNADNSGRTYVHRLPLQAGDSLVLYIRARATLDMEQDAASTAALDPSNVGGDISNSPSATSIAAIFPGGTADGSYGWIGFSGNTSAVNMHLTDSTDPKIFDGHVWRVKITLSA